jgi:hypothetical protein
MNPAAYRYDEPSESNHNVFQKGEYSWRILEINAMEQSKAGNDKIPIKFEFFDEENNTAVVYENLVFTDAAAWKINQFLKSACGGAIEPGRLINFEDAKTINWLKSRTGRAVLGVEKAQGKSGEYDRNKIEKFCYPETTVSGATVSTPPRASTPPSTPVAAVGDDSLEIPF